MQERHLFEYAVIRIVPRVERDEFINAGVILYCSSQGFLRTMYEINEARIRSLYDAADVAEITERIRAFERICKGKMEGGTIGKLPIASRFRWLTATRSTIVQTSKVHPGLCIDPAETLNSLYNQLVK